MIRILFSLLILFACFYGLGGYPVLDNNEGLYAAIARDMLQSHQFIIPHLNGLPYLEKPPMLYWLTTLSFTLFGINEWAAHLVPALALLATVWLMKRFLHRVTGSEETGLTAALIFVTSLPMLAIGRLLICDMLMTCFLTAALLGFYEWHANRKGRLLTFYAFLALAVLTKGLVAIVLTGGAIAIFLLWQRTTLKHYLSIVSPGGILVFLLVAVPWHIAATLQDPNFAWFYFVNEHLLRFLNMRQPHDYYTGHFSYYLPRILGYLLPWTPVVVLLRPPKGDALQQFLWSWFLFCLAFFSLSGAKANYYMISSMPALVMLLTVRMQAFMEASRRLRFAATAAFLLTAALFLAVKLFCRESSGDLYATCEAVSWPIIAAAVIYAATAIILCWRIPLRLVAPLVGSSILVLLPVLIEGIDTAGGYVSQKPVADFLKQSSYHEAAMYQEFEDLSALAFYMDKPLIMVDSQSSDLLYGQNQPGHEAQFMTLQQWAVHKPLLPIIVLNNRSKEFGIRLKALQAGQACPLRKFDRVTVFNPC